ncbi:MAG: sugar ABC transporter substrate-binding protein [Planctomycetaceae bacterium]|nr:sugar ABC transporter substrate-binding protein [Planctomycetaceae bacterium]
MMHRKALAVVALAALFCVLSGKSDAGEKKYTIGLALANLQSDFFNQVRRGAEEQAAKRGVDLIVVEARGDATTQVDQIQDLLAREIDALLITPAGATAAAVPIRACRAKGVPVVTVDRNPPDAPGDSFIAADSFGGCVELGKWVIEKTGGKGTIGVIQGQLGTTPEIDRRGGLMKALESAPEIKVVEQAADSWDQEDGFSVAQDLLQANPDITVFHGRCDALALGAAQAVRLAGLSGKILVVGFDGDEGGLVAVKEGVLDLTMTQQSQRFGRLGIDTCIDLIEGRKVPEMQLIPVTPTTKENVDEFIEKHP